MGTRRSLQEKPSQAESSDMPGVSGMPGVTGEINDGMPGATIMPGKTLPIKTRRRLADKDVINEAEIQNELTNLVNQGKATSTFGYNPVNGHIQVGLSDAAVSSIFGNTKDVVVSLGDKIYKIQKCIWDDLKDQRTTELSKLKLGKDYDHEKLKLKHQSFQTCTTNNSVEKCKWLLDSSSSGIPDCNRCDGEGEVPTSLRWGLAKIDDLFFGKKIVLQKCSACNGSGKQRPCGECRATGTVSGWFGSENECPKCEGTKYFARRRLQVLRRDSPQADKDRHAEEIRAGFEAWRARRDQRAAEARRQGQAGEVVAEQPNVVRPRRNRPGPRGRRLAGKSDKDGTITAKQAEEIARRMREQALQDEQARRQYALDALLTFPKAHTRKDARPHYFGTDGTQEAL